MPLETPDHYALGRRIVIWGATGSGKSTLARQLGAALDLRVIELDAIRHAHGWDSTPYDQMRQRIIDAIAASPGGWVSDGSYSTIHDAYLPHADTVVWLHLPWRVSFWRLLKRTLHGAWTHETLYGETGPHESLRLSFLSTKSIFVWSIGHHRAGVRSVRRRLAALPADVRVYELCSSRDVEAFVAATMATATVVR